MLKILVLYQDWDNRFRDKYEYWFKRMDQAYDKKNQYLFLVMGTFNATYKIEKNVMVRVIKSSPKRQIIDLIRFKDNIRHIIDLYKPNYIYSCFIYMLSMLPKNLNCRVIGLLRDNVPEMIKANGGIKGLMSHYFSYLDKIGLKRVSLLLYNSSHLLDYAIKQGYKGESIMIQRPILDTEWIKKSKPIPNNNKIMILTVARLSPEKRLDLCLKAFNLLPEYFIYYIIGDGPEKKKLKRLANKRVKFISYVPHKYIWKYYKSANVFWLMSSTEGDPNSLREAQYIGLPCIISNNIYNKYAMKLPKDTPYELAKLTMELFPIKKVKELLK